MHCTLYIAQLHVVLLDNVQAQSLSMRLVNFYICGYEYLCILNFLYSVQYTMYTIHTVSILTVGGSPTQCIVAKTIETGGPPVSIVVVGEFSAKQD